jgi:hypothetical protein
MAHGWVLYISKKAKTSAWFTMDTATLTPLVKPDARCTTLTVMDIDYFSGGVIKNNAGEVIELLE